MIALFNSPRLTSFGSFQYEEISLDEAIRLLNQSFESYIGHPSTASVIVELTGIPVTVNRGSFLQGVDDLIIVFELLKRLPDYQEIGKIEIEKIGYRWGLIRRIT